jgi:hypothetical protein
MFPVDDHQRLDLLVFKIFDFSLGLLENRLDSANESPNLPVSHDLPCVLIEKLVQLSLTNLILTFPTALFLALIFLLVL